jgi:nitrite reductase/ring-hydroxylating ferredoxin subunit
LIPNPESENGVVEHTIIDWQPLENNYQLAVKDTARGQPLDPLDLLHGQLNPFASFFYWPYDASASPYYKDVVVRLPDNNPDGSAVSLMSGSDVFTTPSGARFVAYNTTCVHLRCLVNPGYTSEYRLLCPCHGSQYRLVDGVPVAGPAFDLGLLPLPQVKLRLDSTGTKLVAVPFGKNPDGSPILLNGEPGIGRS